jgi:hypothetical protein
MKIVKKKDMHTLFIGGTFAAKVPAQHKVTNNNYQQNKISP